MNTFAKRAFLLTVAVCAAFAAASGVRAQDTKKEAAPKEEQAQKRFAEMSRSPSEVFDDHLARRFADQIAFLEWSARAGERCVDDGVDTLQTIHYTVI